jgi:L-threonylcarbamoyladenylate synthase
VYGTAPEAAAGVVHHVLPQDAVLYARRLYDTLHALDDAGAQAIVVQEVPAGESWWAVADRLRRASAAR